MSSNQQIAEKNYGPFCAHPNVLYVKIDHGNGTCSDSWQCRDCKIPFWPRLPEPPAQPSSGREGEWLPEVGVCEETALALVQATLQSAINEAGLSSENFAEPLGADDLSIKALARLFHVCGTELRFSTTRLAARPAESSGEQPPMSAEVFLSFDANAGFILRRLDKHESGIRQRVAEWMERYAALRQPSEREQELEQQVKAVRESWKREQATYKEIQDENESLAAELQATREALREYDESVSTMEPRNFHAIAFAAGTFIEKLRALLNPTPPESKTEEGKR